MEIQATEPLAQKLTSVIHAGDVETLRQLLDGNPLIAKARLVDQKGISRTLLHIAVDWPGHFPKVAQTIGLLIERGAETNAAAVAGNAPETPLHWAASCNDVDALDALLDGGADIESPGAIFTNGTAMSDAVIFAQWNAARLLLHRGAKTTFTESAGLGLLDRLATYFERDRKPADDQLTAALWHACRGGQLQTAQYLIGKGANVNWVGWDNIAPLDGAQQSGNQDLGGLASKSGSETRMRALAPRFKPSGISGKARSAASTPDTLPARRAIEKTIAPAGTLPSGAAAAFPLTPPFGKSGGFSCTRSRIPAFNVLASEMLAAP